MSAPSPMASLSGVRDRLSESVVDPAPLRRAGLLAVALVVLLAAGRAFGPDAAASSRPQAERQTLQGPTEQVAAPSSSWTGGRVIAVILLLAGGGVALVLRRRSSSAAPAEAVLEVLGTHTLGPGQSLRLVGCGGEVLLLSVGGDGARLLRHWPRAGFEGDDLEEAPAPSFADVLARAAPALEVGPAEASALEAAPASEPEVILEVETPVSVLDAETAPSLWSSAPSLPQFGAHA